MNSEYEVENDDYYKAYMSKPERNESTGRRYSTILRKVYKSTGCTVGEIIEKCLDEQSIVTKEKLPPDENGNERYREIKFNINNKDTTVNKVFNKYEEFCLQRKNKRVSIQAETDSLRAFLSEFGVMLPKRKNYEDDAEEWYLPTKDDFNFIAQDLSLVHQALLNFLISTGMRVSDATSITIGQYMEATSEYHDFVDVDDFIDNAPDDMIGQWEFDPKKTKRKKTPCITFNSTDANNLILQHLRHVKNHYLPFKNNRDKINLKINKKYPLFGSRSHRYEKEITPKSVGGEWSRKNKKFREWKIQQIKQKIENGELSAEDYDNEVSKIPKFHPHICRKFFSTTVSNNCGDVRVTSLLEGHSNGLPNDKFYIKKSVEDIKEIYVNNIHDELCLSNVETRIVSDKETERMNQALAEANAKIETLESQKTESDQKVADLEQKLADKDEEIENIKLSVNDMQKQVNDLGRIAPSRKTKSDIEKAINTYCKNKLNEDDMQKDYVIRSFALDLALENKNDFENNDDYISPLIKKAKIKISLSGKSIDELFNQIMKENDDEYIMNREMTNAVREVMKTMTSNAELMEIISDENYYELQDAIETYLQKSQYDITNLTDADKNEIVGEVLMEFV